MNTFPASKLYAIYFIVEHLEQGLGTFLTRRVTKPVPDPFFEATNRNSIKHSLISSQWF